MEKLNWVWAVVVLPVLVAAFKQELGNAWAAWKVYRYRSFDLDGDPNTPDKVQLLNGATGKWFTVTIEKYVFSLWAHKRGVFIRYADGGREKFTLLDWGKMRKKTVPAI